MSESSENFPKERLKSFEEFWPYYVRWHEGFSTQITHVAGTCATFAFIFYACHMRRFEILPYALLIAYGPAWLSHFFIERNRPATFTYPLWSLRGDIRMSWKFLAGQMPAEVAKARAEKPL
jgi:hypothetical protein